MKYYCRCATTNQCQDLTNLDKTALERSHIGTQDRQARAYAGRQLKSIAYWRRSCV